MPKQPEKVVLEGSLRDSIGKGKVGQLRSSGLIPGVLYGESGPATAIQVPARDLGRALKTKAGENVLITLRLKKDSKALPENAVLIKELQHHPVTHQILHVDFHQISLTKRLTVTVPLAFKGEALGVRQAGGILEHLRWDLEVECLPTEIPAEIPVEVSPLDVGKSLHAKEIPLPSGVRLVTDGELPVVACVIPKKEEEVLPAAEAEAAAQEPEVIKQKKPEEEAPEAASQGKEKEKPKQSQEKEAAKKG
ncbi:MAG: 50S ribosomal protein L25 [Candidatus Omnitrophica bacterium]|nr:50S ribosomal protein L25 [Candidatus Omnitrophota bacterium]